MFKSKLACLTLLLTTLGGASAVADPVTIRAAWIAAMIPPDVPP